MAKYWRSTASRPSTNILVVILTIVHEKPMQTTKHTITLNERRQIKQTKGLHKHCEGG